MGVEPPSRTMVCLAGIVLYTSPEENLHEHREMC